MAEQANESAAPPALPASLEANSAARAAAVEVPPEVPLDAQGRVDAEVQCRRCGYVLMRQFPDADCPECGHAVIDSLRGGVLRFTDPRYLDQLWSGVGIMIGYAVAWFLCLILGWALAMVVGPWGLVLWVIPPLVLAVGVWRMTSFDPARPREEQPNRWRIAARVGAILAPLMLMLTAAIPMIEMMSYYGSGFSEWWVFGSAGVFDVLRVAAKTLALVGLLVCVRQVAKRVPSRAMATQAMILAWGFAAAGLAGLIGKAAYAGAVLMMMSSMSLFSAMGTPVPTPTRPTAPPHSTSTSGTDTFETWTVTRSDGSSAELTITTDAAGEQFWEEMIYDASGNMIAWRDVIVDAGGNATDDMGHGPPAMLEFLGVQAAVATGQPHPGTPVSATASTGISTNPAGASNVTLPTKPSRPPDTTRTLGSATLDTWHTAHADGSSDVYTEQREADGSKTVTAMHVAADGSSTTEVSSIDTTGQVVSSTASQHAAPAMPGLLAGGWGLSVVLMIVGMIGLGLGGAGYLTFFVWLIVLLCLLRPKLREARQFARALTASPGLAMIVV